MKYVRLGGEGPQVSRVGFGCCPMGLHDWGDVDERSLVEAVHRAMELGVNFFDTADIYGLGRSEEILGRALADRREQAVIASKFGVRRSPEGRTYYDVSPEYMRRALEASLRRLGTDYIDLYQVHYDDGQTSLDDLLEELERVRQEGKIRYYGVSNLELTKAPPPGLAAYSYEYSLAWRQNEAAIREQHRRHGATLLTWGSLGQGMLTGKYGAEHCFGPNDRRRRQVYRNFHDNLESNLALVERMREVAQGYPNLSLAQLAIAWVLARFEFAVALVGVKRAAQIEDTAGAAEVAIRPEDMARLE